jgi:hypothetical protein
MLWISLMVLILVSLFVVVPYILVGPPTPLFYVRNHDVGVHELRVEVCDLKNNSILDKTYELSAGEEIYYAKPSGSLFQSLKVRVIHSNLHLITVLRKHIVRTFSPGTQFT